MKRDIPGVLVLCTALAVVVFIAVTSTFDLCVPFLMVCQ